jgi:hypothetical protein
MEPMRAEHLSEAEFAGFLDHELSDAEVSSVESHLEICAGCRAALVDMSRTVHSRLTSIDGPLAVAAKRNRWRRRMPAMIGAAAAATFAVVFVSRQIAPTTSESKRRNPAVAADPQRMLNVFGPPEHVTRGDSPLKFIWQSANTASYRFSIRDETGKPVLERKVSDTVVLVALESIEPGRLYVWRVDAIADGGSATTGARKLKLAE